MFILFWDFLMGDQIFFLSHIWIEALLLVINWYIRVCLSCKMISIHFLGLCKVWSILHHESVGRVHKKMLLSTFLYFFGIFLLFFIIKFLFLIYRILINQKHELVAPTVSGTIWYELPPQLPHDLSLAILRN